MSKKTPTQLKTFMRASLVAAAGLLAFVPAKAFAQDIVKQYDPDYRPDFLDDIVKPEEEIYLSTGIDQNIIWAGQFVRVPDDAPNNLTMRVKLSQTLSGCYTASTPRAEIKYQGSSVRVEYEPMRINIEDSERAYSQHECDVKSGAPHMDIVLDRQLLMENNTNKIMIGEKNTRSSYPIKIDITPERVVTVTPIATMAKSGKNPLDGNNIDIFWTYPENTIILYNETIPLNDQYLEKLTKFAQSRGLVPLTDFLPDFRIEANNRHGLYFLNAKHKMYFVDQTGAFASQLEGIHDVERLGTITDEEIYHGPDGPYEKAVKIPVFMKLPGLYE